ncbi:uncharacterized protein B0H18DRAFT_971384 [Fomitopsis serialis]|uniref:uncharacterized protein n=1 Tax=Fomitopsis serialis TaxID=139415 RepID=UPI002008B895|nr:uncharacterized protein B0H18DRAFT_971384 [Neoantrodia serialis]KAH9937601.1 hypothetical protein B0H18DRAFT_971384 [Neoantrodia serialis]
MSPRYTRVHQIGFVSGAPIEPLRAMRLLEHGMRREVGVPYTSIIPHSKGHLATIGPCM